MSLKVVAAGTPYGDVMSAQVFKVVKDPVGWTVCFGEAVTSSFRTRRHAIQEAHRLCQSLRTHGLDVAVIVVDEDQDQGGGPRFQQVRGDTPVRR